MPEDSPSPLNVTLAHKWEESIDPTGYLVSEKLDGVRAVWTRGGLYSRNGKGFNPPGYFTSDFPPDLILDGELFGGRGSFQNTVGVVKSSTRGEEWDNLVFMVFDSPSITGPFEERYAQLSSIIEKQDCRYLTHVNHEPCTSKAHMEASLKSVLESGGEGLMLREPKGGPPPHRYVEGRTKSLLKVKTFSDTDGVVIGHKDGKGRNKGVMGALNCALASDPKKKFSVGTGFNDEQRKTPPAIGSIIIVRYQELTKSGVPRFPVYIGERAETTTVTAD